MIFDPAALNALATPLLATAAIFARVGAMMFLIPGFGEAAIPMRIRLAAAISFSLVLAPLMTATPGIASLDPVQIAQFLITEASIGCGFGLLLRLFVMALQTAGTIAAQSTSLSQIFGGTAGADPQPAMGHLLTWAALAFAVASGLHLRLITFFARTYDIFPAGSTPSSSVATPIVVERIAQSFALAFSIAAPFLIASMLYNVTLGVINRAMPQLMVSFVGAPAITAGGLALLMVLSPAIIHLWHDSLTRFMLAPAEAGF